MSGRQRIVPVRRDYNRWVANQTLEDFALRFTAKAARRWSSLRVAHTALGAISFLALEAIGGTITLSYGFTNAVTAILAVGVLIFATGLPISYFATRYGVDIDLLTRGAGFGYIGSTVTSLIYASFTFIFFAIEAAIMAMALEMCFGLPLAFGYVVSSVVVIPLVTHGITFISRFQIWTQPIWIVLHLLPFGFIAVQDPGSMAGWAGYEAGGGSGFNLVLFGAAASVIFSLMAQIGEQVDFLRFMPRIEDSGSRAGWWLALTSAGAGWIVLGALKLLAGSFLAVLALAHGVAPEHAAEPTRMYEVAFGYVISSPNVVIGLTGAFVVLSQLKINVTNSYAGSIAWSNFFSRLTHSHPGRVVWLVFNVAIALVLMELGIYKALEQTLGLYSIVAVAWVGALTADLVVNKPLGLSPPGIEFKRAHLYDVNPVGVGAMTLAVASAGLALTGILGSAAQALASFVALGVAFLAAPAIAYLTGGRFYLARKPRANWQRLHSIGCRVCEHAFEPEDMAFCPAYSGPICSLCCSLDARCHDLCKPKARLSEQVVGALAALFPPGLVARANSRVGHFLGVMALLCTAIGVVFVLIYLGATSGAGVREDAVARTLWAAALMLTIVAGIAAWLFVLAQESRHVAQEESARQTTLLFREIEAHKRTDAKLQRAKEAAEAANLAKSRYVVGISHELRTPLNAVLGYAQLLERDPLIPHARQGGIRVIRRSAEHLSGLIDGLLDISKIEAGRLQLSRNEVRIADFLDQLVEMFRLQAEAKSLEFRFERPENLPEAVFTDEKRLRQILINLLSNAIKFTEEGSIALKVAYRNQVAEFVVEDTGAGIAPGDLTRIFEPFERIALPDGPSPAGTGLGLTITKLLAEIMGGEIAVESEPGRGSRFRVKLLLSAVREPSPSTSPEKRITGYEGRRRTVLVVDDDPDHRDLIREILAPLGFIVLTAPDGPTCLTVIEQCRPDLFLIDIAMPGMSGWDLARALREREHSSAPIVIMSANVGESPPAPGEAPLFDEMLAKPFELRTFLDRIGHLLRLTWLNEAPRPGTPVEMPRGGPGPDQHQRGELIRLGRIGYVRGIEAKLAELENSAVNKVFVDELRAHIRSFDFRRYLSALESAGSDD
jgi:signal transduction histidine kinase/CheY-like chemotaxis protein